MIYKYLLYIFLVSQIAFGAVIEKPVDYSQHKLIRITPGQSSDLQLLNEIKANYKVLNVLNFENGNNCKNYKNLCIHFSWIFGMKFNTI